MDRSLEPFAWAPVDLRRAVAGALGEAGEFDEHFLENLGSKIRLLVFYRSLCADFFKAAWPCRIGLSLQIFPRKSLIRVLCWILLGRATCKFSDGTLGTMLPIFQQKVLFPSCRLVAADAHSSISDTLHTKKRVASQARAAL